MWLAGASFMMSLVGFDLLFVNIALVFIQGSSFGIDRNQTSSSRASGISLP